MISARAKARGVSESEYMSGNLLQRAVTADDVAQAFVSLALAPSTTAQPDHAPTPIPVASEAAVVFRPYWNTSVPADEGRLRVTVLLPDGSKARGLCVRLEAEERVHKRSSNSKRFKRRWLQSTIRVKRILPGVPFELVVEDAYRQPVHSVAQLALSGGEERAVEVTLPRAPRTLSVEVINPDGHPVPWAYVHARAAGDAGSRSDGKRLISSPSWPARFRGVFAETVTLRLEAHGHRDVVYEDVRVPASDEPLRLVMDPSRTLRVLVQDAQGLPGHAVLVEAVVNGVSYYAIREAVVGVWTLEDLPAGDLELRVDIGTEVLRLHHNTLLPLVTVRMPGNR